MIPAENIFAVQGRYLVTGATSGIGESIARRLKALGASVVVSGRDEKKTIELAKDIGGSAAVMDIADAAQVQGAFNQAGPLDGVIHAAGAGGLKPILEMTPEDWHETIATDLDGAFFVLQSAARSILRSTQKGGSIVLISSVNARFVHRGLAAYASAKAGVEQLTRIAALELGEAGIRVNAVAPGAVDTPMAAGVISNPEMKKAFEAGTPFGRIADPDDIADLALFLLTPASRWLTGQTLTADGGLSLRVEPRFTPAEQWTATALRTQAA